MAQINGILEVPYLEGTPARADHRNGIIYISKKDFDGMDPVYKAFILAHEEGHLALNTKKEELADEYAMNKLIQQGYPLSKILASLTDVLQYNKKGHYGRTYHLFNKLFLYDLLANQNKRLFNHLNLVNMTTPDQLSEIYTASYESEFSDFLGLGKKAAERRQERHDARMDKKEAKNKIREARAKEKEAKAEAIRSGTYQPESFGSSFAKALGGIGNAAASILGGKNTDTDTFDFVEKKGKDDGNMPKENNYTKWIVIAIVLIIIIIAAYFIFLRKGGKK